MSRSEARVHVMTVLYQVTLYEKNKINYDIDKVINEQIEDGADFDFVKQLINGVLENDERIEETANKYLNNWNLERLGVTDQAILKMAIYELLYTDTPSKVVINEAIELAKKYSDDQVVKMINGVLDKVYHNEVMDAE